MITESHVTRKRWIRGHKPLELGALGLMLCPFRVTAKGVLCQDAQVRNGGWHLNENKTERELAL